MWEPEKEIFRNEQARSMALIAPKKLYFQDVIVPKKTVSDWFWNALYGDACSEAMMSG